MFEREDLDPHLWKGLQALLNRGSFRIADGKVKRKKESFGYTLNGPWVFIRGIDCRECYKWTAYHNHWGFVPEYCWKKCWKVVVGVKTLTDAHQLYNIAVALNFPGKVGINQRAYVKGPYLGFFYSESEEEAIVQKEAFKEHLEQMVPEHEIVYKQMCTEFTQSGAQPNPHLEHKLDHIFEPIPDENMQPAWLKSAVKWEWNNFANLIGDPTAIDATVKCAVKE